LLVISSYYRQVVSDRLLVVAVGTFITCKCVAPHMMGRRQGSIITIASVQVRVAYSLPNNCKRMVYNTTNNPLLSVIARPFLTDCL
jgi:NAD(P)-dependent dehydrogenase (short-subunit alcohol dehydrogenase family)